jgi:hypothetical protein
MTGDYIELANIDEALRYIQTVLEQGKTLGLLASTALKVVGGVYAFAPLWPKQLALPPLTQGGIPESAGSYAALASEIDQHLSGSASKIVIFEDALASAGDPWLEGPAASGLRMATYGSEIYYLLLAEDAGTRRIAETVAIGLSESYHAVGLFSELASGHLVNPITLSIEDISAIVQGTTSMVVGAFDGESFLRVHVQETLGHSELNP